MGFGSAVLRALAGIGLTALALAPTAQASSGGHLPCPRRGAEVIASNGLVRVYAYPPTKARDPRPRRTEACAVQTGARMTLFDPEQPETRFAIVGVDVVALSGTVLAYSVRHVRADSSGSDLFLAQVASRRILRELPGDSFADAGFIGATFTTDFALDSSGSAAWIDETLGPISNRTKTFAVRAAPLDGEEVVLDEAPSIAPRSLKLTTDTLSWQDGAMRRTARLTP